MAIYDGLLAPENIIGTNLQNLVNFVASVVGWALLVPLYQPQKRTGKDRVRRSTSTQDHHGMVEEEYKVEEEMEHIDNNEEEEKMEELFSSKLPSAHTIATVLRSIA